MTKTTILIENIYKKRKGGRLVSLNNIVGISQIIASITSILVVVFTFRQLKLVASQLKATLDQVSLTSEQVNLSTKDYSLKNDRESRLKAIEIADEFRILILSDLSYVSSVSKDLGISKILQSVQNSEFIHFDTDELKSLFGDQVKKLEEINKNLNKPENVTILSKLYMHNASLSPEEFNRIFFFFTHDWDLEEILKVIDGLEEDVITSIFDKNINPVIIRHLYSYYKMKIILCYHDKLDNLLNKLEQLAMYFNNNLADEEVIYQSLHQTYLSIVKSLYYEISKRNQTNNTDKYYTNIIALYHKWSEVKKSEESKIVRSTPVRHKKPLDKVL